MGNVYISLDKEYEELLRRLAKERHGTKKGAISETVEDALDQLKEREEKESLRKKFFDTIEKGINLGFKGKLYTRRSELYD